LLLLVFFSNFSNGKIIYYDSLKQAKGTVVYVKIIDGETLPIIDLKEYRFYSEKFFKNPKDAIKFDKLKRDVKKAYPYSKIASQKLKEYEVVLSKIENEYQRKYLMKKAEKELIKEFKHDIMGLTMKQGKILIKLIDRETQHSSYELVSEFRGGFSAFMWQGLARMFGANLKEEYDATGEDKMIEEIIKLIENGDL